MTGRRTTGGRAAAVLAGAALAAVLVPLAGCSSSDNGGTAADAPARGPGQPEAAQNDAAEKDAGAGAPPAAQPGAQPAGTAQPGQPARVAPEDRSIIYIGSMTVRVEKVDKAANDAAALANRLGGFVGGDNRSNKDDRSEARLILRIPAGQFSAALTALAELGTEEGREVSTQDVTEQVVDVDARIATAQASVDRVRALLARAQTIGEIVQLEAEVSRREAELESLKARKRKLADQTSLSTVTVILLGPDAVASPPDDEPETGFIAGLKAGWRAFVTSMEVLLTVVGALLPWFVALGIPVWVLVYVLRRNGARRGAPVAAPPVSGPPAPREPVSAPPARDA